MYDHIKKPRIMPNMQLPKLNLVLFTFGNVSAVDRSAGVFAIKPSGVPYEELSPAKMVIVDFDGNTLEGKLRPSSDTKHMQYFIANGKRLAELFTPILLMQLPGHKRSAIFLFTEQPMLNHNTVDIPCAAPMSDEMIKGNYEYETGFQIIDCLDERKLSYEEIEMILVGNHAPFTWGKTPEKAVYNSAVPGVHCKNGLLNGNDKKRYTKVERSVIKKHFERKHGPDHIMAIAIQMKIISVVILNSI
jgi:L-ribulose-5-phosphate 4-epimerase